MVNIRISLIAAGVLENKATIIIMILAEVDVKQNKTVLTKF